MEKKLIPHPETLDEAMKRLHRESMKEEKKPYDLTKNGPVLSLTPVVVQMTDYADFSVFYTGAVVCIDTKKRYPYMGDRQVAFQFARHIPRKTTRPMTAQEIAMLPRGTAFVHGNNWRMYNPVIIDCTDGTMCIGNEDSLQFNGYILPTETEVRPFTTEESK
jgi:hypothetical protein